ncbi:glycosyltransferase family 2 protein [Hymenobacter bucti]|uniref:Glycosyltransferase family 2 protein n=1 Tax=Hymenobacter bucti TaxID=1844114 RepID=A0ABW4QWY4_9BACT
MNISICIPTYNRPDVLQQAVESCLNQTHRPYEILIGDDSSLNDTEEWVNANLQITDVRIRYFHNRPSLRQARNVNSLFMHAEGELTVLLHDDDVLLPTALETLHSCFVAHPTIDIAFGKQYVMSNDGRINEEESESLNKTYYRTAAYEGVKLSSLESGFLQQFPNDAYMIKSAIVKKVQYNEGTGDACDFDFGLQIGKGNYKMFFVNSYTACYRISDSSVGTKADNNASIYAFDAVDSLNVPAESSKYKHEWLVSKAPAAIANAAKLQDYKRALEIYFSDWHKHNILSLSGIKLFLIISFLSLKGSISRKRTAA